MILYHYYDLEVGPFRNLSDLGIVKANQILNEMKSNKPNTYASSRQENYMQTRLSYEDQVRELFLKAGGKAERKFPHYLVVEECEWLNSWYESPGQIQIPIEEFDLSTLSFTYGDMHPTFSPRVNDGREYRKQLYLYEDILKIIEKYGLPQCWNKEGKFGPERYVEVQVWSDETVGKYLNQVT